MVFGKTGSTDDREELWGLCRGCDGVEKKVGVIERYRREAKGPKRTCAADRGPKGKGERKKE